MFYFYLSALLSLAVAVRSNIENSQVAYSEQQQQQQASQDLWDRIDIHELDKQLAAWNNEPISSSETPAPVEAEIQEPRHGYVDIPRPIPPIPIRPTLPPEPTHPPKGCLAPRGQFPSSRSCAHYLNCWDDVVIEQQCPGGLLFNEITSYCDFEHNVYCHGRPAPPPKPELPPGAKICPDPNGRYRSTTNCSEFYVCVYGRPIKYSCPRRLVYNEDLGVCDYPYRVDCRGASVPPVLPPVIQPHPHPPIHPPVNPPHILPYPPVHPTQPPHPHPPYYPPPHYPYLPEPAPKPPSSNPWIESRIDPDPWHQRPAASVFEIEQEKDKLAKTIPQEQELLGEHGANVGPLELQQDTPQKQPLLNPWGQVQAIPAQLTKLPCKDGDLHRLTDSCSSVVVCRKGRPQLLQCPSPQIYDRSSDSCKIFTLAKC